MSPKIYSRFDLFDKFDWIFQFSPIIRVPAEEKGYWIFIRVGHYEGNNVSEGMSSANRVQVAELNVRGKQVGR